MQYHQFGAGAYPIGRTGEADAGGDVKLGGGFAVIAIRTLVDEFHHQRVGPELPVVRVATKCQVDTVHDRFVESERLMIQDNQGLTGIYTFQEAMQAPALPVD